MKAGDILNKKQIVKQVLDLHYGGYEIILPDIHNIDSKFQVKKDDSFSEKQNKICMQYKEGLIDSLLMLLLFNEKPVTNYVEFYTKHFDSFNPIELEIAGLFGLGDAGDSFLKNTKESFPEFCVKFVENRMQKRILKKINKIF